MSKIIDIFNYDGQINLLKIKFNYTSNLVDKYWIIDTTIEQNLSEIIDQNFEFLRNKIFITSGVDIKIYDEKLKKLFIQNNINFDDIVIISNIDEVYNGEIIESLELHLPFSPQILQVYNCDENLKVIDSESTLGPIILYRTDYTKFPNYTDNLFLRKFGYKTPKPDELKLTHGYKVKLHTGITNYNFILD
jgi:hypothetical protein